MAIRIVTDSTSDIPIEMQKQLDIDIVPLSVLFGDDKYTDGVELKKEKFFEMLGQCTQLPTTSQVNPDGFHDLFKEYVDAGDQVIGIFISSKLSGTYQSAVIAKDIIGSDDIYLVDSLSATFGLALLVYEAIEQRNNGISAQQIYSDLMRLRNTVEFIAAVDTLKYLKMGGRLSSSAALIGEVLSIKPLISIVNGEVKSIAKARGQKAAFAQLVTLMKENPPNEKYPLIFGHSNAPEIMRDFISNVEAAGFDVEPKRFCEIGCVIGTHAGPGCAGVAYFKA